MCCVVAVVVKFLMAMVKISTLGHTCMCCVVVVKFLMAMVKISTLGRTCMCCVAVVIFYSKYIYSIYTHT